MMHDALIAVALALLVVSQSACADADRDFDRAINYGATAQLTVAVVDDQRRPVEGARIEARFDPAFNAPGETRSFTTDANGRAVVSGRTGKSVSVRVTKDGYYGSSDEIGYVAMGQGVKEGKWQPWNIDFEIVLRPVKNPVAVKVPVDNWLVADTTNQWIGLDLETYDFVEPHGRGLIADMDIKIDWDGRRWPNSAGMDVSMRFIQEHAGGYYQDRLMKSDFKDTYSASTNAQYQKNFRFYEHPVRNARGDIIGYDAKDFDSSKVLVIRSRCVLDEKGELLAARYSQISNLRFSCVDSGACIMFQPIVNPTPNDTNLEPKK